MQQLEDEREALQTQLRASELERGTLDQTLSAQCQELQKSLTQSEVSSVGVAWGTDICACLVL